MSKHIKAVVDADYICYAVASAGEKRSVRVVHKSSGREIVVPTRSGFYGGWHKKEGGMLAEINKAKNTSFTWEDFEYIDVQQPDPIENVLHSAKLMYERVIKDIGATRQKGFIGTGRTFRHDVATIVEYKGGRKDLLKPLLLDDVKAYLVKKFNVEEVSYIEADDACIIEAYRKKDHVVIGIDKDITGCAVQSYNPNYPEQGIVNGDVFGKMRLTDKGEVKGIGRMFMYFQCAYGDRSDGYFANSASDIKWGEKSAYKALVECKNDKEALTALMNIYKKLYPEPKIITGWRGDQIEIDWKYVLNENWQLCRMLRTRDELENRILATDILDRMGVDYGS